MEDLQWVRSGVSESSYFISTSRSRPCQIRVAMEAHHQMLNRIRIWDDSSQSSLNECPSYPFITVTWVYIFQWTSEQKSQLFVVCLFVFEAWIIFGIIWSPWLCLGFQFHIRVRHTAGWGLDIDGSEERKNPRADWSGVTLPCGITHKDAGKMAWIRSRWQCRLLPNDHASKPFFCLKGFRRLI